MLIPVICLFASQAISEIISDINIINNSHRSKIVIGFNNKPVYAFLLLHNPERIVIDIAQKGLVVPRLPIVFSGNNLIKRIRVGMPEDKRSLRLIFELNSRSYVQAITRYFNGRYNIILTVHNSQLSNLSKNRIVLAPITFPSSKLVNTNKSRQVKNRPVKNLVSTSVPIPCKKKLPILTKPIVVAIDAGHGGQDLGAIGPNGLYEKNVTIAIANKLKILLDSDPMFKPVLTRDGDYFISVIGRSNVARKKGANVLLSIHADASSNRHNASGASLWILSNQRANSEMLTWLEQHDKQSELLGGIGDLLAKNQTDPYFSRAVLDLQFRYSQRVSYDIAVKILNQLRQVSTLHKIHPEHASFGVLRSPDIPSLLVETGFISNIYEERLLGSSAYQQKIANALHLGLRSYFVLCPIQVIKAKV